MYLYGLHLADLLVIAFYFAVVLYIGFRVMKKVHTQEDFFLGGRQFNRFFQTFSQFGQATSTESAVTTVSVVGVNGIAGATQQAIMAGFGYPINWLFPKWLRRTRLMSMAGYFEERFDSRMLARLYAIAQTCLFLMVGGMGLYAMSKTIMAITEKPVEALSVAERAEYDMATELGYLSSQPAELLSEQERTRLDELRLIRPTSHFSYVNRAFLVVAIAIIVFLYAATGGLEAAVYTDTLQGIFILILTVLLVPFAMVQLNTLHGTSGFLGPFEAIHRSLPQTMFELLGNPRWVEFTWYNITIMAFIGLAGNIAYSNNLVVAGAARTDKVASWGGLTGQLTKGIAGVFWIVLALLIIGLFGEQTGDPDLLWGQAARTLLPVGLLGLLIACLMAAFMSSADMHMMTVSGLLTHNIYKPLVPNRSEAHYVNAGRLLTLVYIVGAVVFALNAESIFRMWKFMLLINLCCGPAMLMGFLWRRTNTAAVWASMGLALLMTLVIPAVVMAWPGAKHNPSLLLEVRSPSLVKSYVASERDVAHREKRIADWELLAAEGLATGERPAALALGERFDQTYEPAARAVFWDGGIRMDTEGRRYGSGFFKPELYLLHLLGLDLSRTTPSRVEMISLLFRLLFPFLAVLLVGSLTKPLDESRLNYFYAKQRTPVDPDHAEDARQIEETRRDPARFNREKLWPGSNWEFGRLPAYDIKGLSTALAGGLIFILLIIGIAHLGS